MDKLLLTRRQEWQSNYLLIHLAYIIVAIVGLKYMDSEIVEKSIVLATFSSFVGISYFQLESRLIKINWWIFVSVFSVLLGLAAPELDTLWLGIVAYFLLLLHGVLFSFRAIGE